MFKVLIKTVLVLLSFNILLPAFPIRAANSLGIVINEIAWMGTKDGWYFEWIELSNNTQERIDLSGWKIENAGKENETLVLEGIIPPKGFFLICKKELRDCNFKTWHLSLKDNYKGNGKLVLKDGEENFVDQTPFADNLWPAGNKKTKETMERIDPNASGNKLQNWQTSQYPEGTPGAKNSLVAAQSQKEVVSITETSSQEKLQFETYSSGILINEILPSPKGKDALEEWIELFNENTFDVDLSLWKIQDTKGKTKSFVFPKITKIKARRFLLLLRPETKITLNNDGDGLKLFWPDGKLINEVHYDRAIEGQSFVRINNDWQWSSIPTPGTKNSLPKREEAEINPETQELTGNLREIFQEESKKSFKNVSFLDFYSILFIAFGEASLFSCLLLFLRKRLFSKK